MPRISGTPTSLAGIQSRFHEDLLRPRGRLFAPPRCARVECKIPLGVSSRHKAVIGRRLSHYDVLADLGAGGMGVVYRAHDTRLDRDVAIKVLPTDRPLSQTARRRFQREAMAASALNHP